MEKKGRSTLPHDVPVLKIIPVSVPPTYARSSTCETVRENWTKEDQTRCPRFCQSGLLTTTWRKCSWPGIGRTQTIARRKYLSPRTHKGDSC